MLEKIECGAIAKDILDKVKNGISELIERDNGLDRSDTDTAIISINADEPSRIYMRRKLKDAEYVGVNASHFDLTFDKDADRLEELNRLKQNITAILSSHACYIFQRPIPKEIEQDILNHMLILGQKAGFAADIDALDDLSIPNIYKGNRKGLHPCTAEASYDLIRTHLNDNIKGAEVLIIGRSNLVGKPLTLMLMNAGASVTVIGSTVKSLDSHLKNKDIIVTAVGKANLFNATQLSQNTYVIDVGISRLPNGKITGDMDHSMDSEDMNIKFTPVPKGVGLLTTAYLFLNVYKHLLWIEKCKSEVSIYDQNLLHIFRY